jgi:hypothetical protein
MNRAAVIDELKATPQTLSKVLALLESSEANKFVAPLFQAPRQYRLVCERPNKENKAVDREVIASFQLAQSPGFKRDFPAWEHLPGIHE